MPPLLPRRVVRLQHIIAAVLSCTPATQAGPADDAPQFTSAPSQADPRNLPLKILDGNTDPVTDTAASDEVVVLLEQPSTRIEDRADHSVWSDPDVHDWASACKVYIRGNQLPLPRSMARFVGPYPPPGVYAFRRGRLIDRDTEIPDAPRFLTWAKHISTGAVPAEWARERAGPRDGGASTIAHVILAERLERLGLIDEAADEATWAFETCYRARAKAHAAKSQEEVRAATDEAGMRAIDAYDGFTTVLRLSTRCAAVRPRLDALRDELIAQALASTDHDSYEAALEACAAAPDIAVLRRFGGALKDKPGAQLALGRVMPDLVASLAAQKRWADAGAIIIDPDALVEFQFGRLEIANQFSDAGPVDQAAPDAYRQMELNTVRPVAIIYAALLAAGREEDAARAADLAIKTKDSPTLRAHLVLYAIAAGEPRPLHREWAERGQESWVLKKPPPPGGSLVERLDSALAKKKSAPAPATPPPTPAP